MSLLTVYRQRDYFGMYRRLAVRIDGRRVARLRRGESVTVEVAGDRHSIEVRTGRAKSPTVWTEHPGPVTFVCGWRNSPSDGVVGLLRQRREPIYIAAASDEAIRGDTVGDAADRRTVVVVSASCAVLAALAVARALGISFAGALAVAIALCCSAVWTVRWLRSQRS